MKMLYTIGCRRTSSLTDEYVYLEKEVVPAVVREVKPKPQPKAKAKAESGDKAKPKQPEPIADDDGEEEEDSKGNNADTFGLDSIYSTYYRYRRKASCRQRNTQTYTNLSCKRHTYTYNRTHCITHTPFC